MTIQVPPAAEDYIKRKAPETGVSFTPAEPAPSTLDSNISNYLDNVSANLGKESYTTEAGKLYADRVTNGLKTPDASSVNAQNTEDTAASRRQYMANLNAGEAVGQSGFALGSAQATRIADQSQAGVNQANQAGQSAVNAYIRQRTEDNMARARGLEADQQNQNQTNLANVQNQSDRVYGRGQDTLNRAERADQTTYNRTQDALNRTDNLDQRSWEREQVLKGNDETAKRNLLNSLPDGPAKNAVLQGLSNGSLTVATALAQVMNPDGSIKDGTEGGGVNYRGKTPGALGQDAEKEYAIQTLEMDAAANGTAFDPNSPEGIKAIAAKMLATRTAKDTPVNDQTEARDLAAAKKRIASLPDGQVPAQKDLDLLPSINIQAIPVKPKDLNPWLAANDTGGWVKIGGEPYEVIRGGNEIGGEEGDYVEIRDAEGGTHYIIKGGTMTDTKPGRQTYAANAYVSRSRGR